MGFKLTESEDTFEPIPEGIAVAAVVDECKEQESPFDIDKEDPSKGKQRQVSFKFKVTEEEYENRVLFGNTPTTFTTHPDCKLRAWVQEILGMDSLPKDFEFDESDLEGLPVNVIVGHRKKKNADKTEGVRDFAQDVARIDSGAELAGDIF